MFGVGSVFKKNHFFELRQGDRQDYTKAREWFEKAAALENADAQFYLGFMYDIGRWIDFYNRLRPHTALCGITPDMCHELNLTKAA